MKIKEKQYLRSLLRIAVLALLGLVLLIVTMPLGQNYSDSMEFRTKQKAEILAYQVMQLYRESTRQQGFVASDRKKAFRQPASDMHSISDFKISGYMGQDPWGMPYNYRILRTEDGKTRIWVWSGGPNQISELNEKDLLSKNVSSTDDIGINLIMREQD